MRARQSLLTVIATMAAAATALGGCTGSGSNGSSAANAVTGNPLTVNSGTPKQGGSITYVIERNIDDWNPLAADIGVATQLVGDAFAPQTFTTAPDLNTIQMNKDLLVSAKEVSTSPQTMVYKINPKAVWSDGTPINADDFQYTWATADKRKCPKCDMASVIGYEHLKSVVGSDGGKTVTVTMENGYTYSDWKAMFSPLLPAHIARNLGNDGTPAGLATSFNQGFRYNNSFPRWSGGPYMMKSWKDNQAATLVPNPKWYGKRPPLKSLIFRVITDTTQEVPALKNNEVQVINPQPQIDLLNNVKASSGVKYQMVHGLKKQTLQPNLHSPAMKNPSLRRALFTATDVKQMIAKTVGQFDSSVKPLRNRFYVPQQAGYSDTLGDLGTGNIAKAKQILSSAGYKVTNGRLVDPKGTAVPPLTMRYTQGDQLLQTECELFAATAKKLGVTITIRTTDNIGETVTHQPGKDYDILASAWIGQSFIPTQYSQAFVTGSGLNFGGYSNPQVDKLMRKALYGETSQKQVAKVLNTADRQMTDDGYILPLYQMPDLLAYRSNLVNVRANGTYFGPPYNSGEWGIK